jgi:hypothetical protein
MGGGFARSRTAAPGLRRYDDGNRQGRTHVLVAPDSVKEAGHVLTRDAAQGIDPSISSPSTFLGFEAKKLLGGTS